MVKRGEEFLCGASERLASLEERSVAGRRSRFSEKKSSRGVFGESARAAAMILVARIARCRTSRQSQRAGPGPFFGAPSPLNLSP
jgi:hypothetical protein